MTRGRLQLRRENGQSLVIVVVFMIVLLGFCALVLDVGHAYLAQRRLQSSVDAAALAGATALPSVTNANSLASSYGEGGKNTAEWVDNVQMTIATKCLAGVPGCTTANAVSVKETGVVHTIFGGLLGVPTFGVNASATACSPCGAKPLDIVLVLDRTGSMCTTPDGADDHPACTDMENARAGLKTFLSQMDPNLDHVGLAVLPPAPANGSACSDVGRFPYDNPDNPYVVVPLSNDYATAQGTLDPSSQLVSTINCVQAAGTTSYASALEAAQAELVKDGRPGVQDVIVLLSDGAANTGPTFAPASYRDTPCHQGIDSSAAIQAAGTLVYSIGYDVGHDVCRSRDTSLEAPSIQALGALQGIASPGNFYNQPDAAQLNTIFTSIAADLLQGTSRLVDDGP